MLWGWITTSTRFISTPKSQCASIISSPLLNRVAESIVIFGPMFQVGCWSDCSGVIASQSLRGDSRNGPPEALRRIRRTSETSNAQRPTPNAELSELDVERCALCVERLLVSESFPSKH